MDDMDNPFMDIVDDVVNQAINDQNAGMEQDAMEEEDGITNAATTQPAVGENIAPANDPPENAQTQTGASPVENTGNQAGDSCGVVGGGGDVEMKDANGGDASSPAVSKPRASQLKNEDDNNDEKGKGDDEDDEDVQILTAKQAERELRRKKRRRLYKLLHQKNQLPSFMSVLNTVSSDEEDAGGKEDGKEKDNDDEDDDDDIIPPPVVVIDVDAYLGFKEKHPLMITSSNSISAIPSAVLSYRPTPSAVASSSQPAVNPADEGWYEGSRTMSMPEDSTFLSDLHVWVRQNMEYFSAKEVDVQQSQAGRRSKAVPGQVGIRCIHCARKILPKLKKGEKASWPAGAVSYPVNFAGMYAGASQKPQMHFEACPYLPKTSKLATMLQEARSNQMGNSPLTGIGKRKRMVQGVSGIMYYTISGQRIGLQEVANQGLRFSRDLSLEPLDFETVRNQVERENPDMIPKQYQPRSSLSPVATPRASSGPDRVSSAPRPSPATPAANADASAADRIMGDAETQKVLQAAVEEAEKDAEGRLVQPQDRELLTDYMFLAIAQMAICHATKEDFSSRGKKTKLMRLGLAGFCCRHCKDDNSLYSCRSFSSAADNLASAISNSFIIHLLKCRYVPHEINSALLSLKRLHSKQMAQLPYGSQRRFFFDIWERLRAADKSKPPSKESVVEELEEGEKDQGVDKDDEDEDWSPDSEQPQDEEEEPKATSPPPVVSSSIIVESSRPNARGINFPVTSDPETQEVLKQAEESWDPAQNDNLIMPGDRNLVSDYVFLTMRQLKMAIPTPADFRGNRRSTAVGQLPGMCCLHCSSDTTFLGASGRTFPSAPDNMASALNSSFYNHMQQCPHCPMPLKRAFQNLRQIHSQQCSSLTFGSQRRFFNRVFERLKQSPLSEEQIANLAAEASRQSTSKIDSIPLGEADKFRKLSFVSGGTVGLPYWQCLKCRMVPFELRATGAVHYVRPSVLHLKQHMSICQKDGIFLGWMAMAMEDLEATYKDEKLHEALEPLVSLVVGGAVELKKLFLECTEKVKGKDNDLSQQTSGWWRRLPTSIDFAKVQETFEKESAALLNLSSRNLRDHPKWLRVLEIMSPYLQCPPQAEESVSQNPETVDESSANDAKDVGKDNQDEKLGEESKDSE